MQGSSNLYVTRLLLLSVAVYIIAAWYVGWGDIYHALSSVDITVVLIPLLFSLTAYILRFVRWQYYLTVFNKTVHLYTSLLIYFAGFALAMTPGRVGELVRGTYLKAYNVSYRRSSAMFVVEKVLDIISMLLLSAFVFNYFTDKLEFVYIIVAFVVVIMVFLINPLSLLALRRFFSNTKSRLHKALRHVLDVFLHTGKILRPVPVFVGLVLGTSAWGLDAAGFYYITSYYIPDISLFTVIGVYTLSVLLGAFSFMPGGVGATEALMFGFLHLLDLKPEQAVVVIIISRLTSMWFSVFLGAVSVYLLRKYEVIYKAEGK